MSRVRRRTPTFLSTYPPQYATTAELEAEGLHSAENLLPAALSKCKDRESISAQYARAEATAIVQSETWRNKTRLNFSSALCSRHTQRRRDA